jgi:F-type H+-transporting ATPase subunit b
LRFVTDPDLIAGLELRGAHFVLHNSWRADIEQILKEIGDAA